MRKEIDFDLGLSVSKEVLLDHHSLFNLLNVLQFELNALLEKVDDSLINGYKDFVIGLLITLGERKLEENSDEIEEKFLSFANDLKAFSNKNKSLKNQVDIILDIVEVALVRISEFKQNRFTWTYIPITEFQSKLDSFFKVIEKVSRQRFSIVYPPKNPGSSDYLINFEMPGNSESLYAPLIIHDIIRDLSANSRKYSLPGSAIKIRLVQVENDGIRLTITDEGMGIPEAEIGSVVKFKHRGSNVSEIRSMGEGFGLTKAYHVCKVFNGTFVIKSEVNQGTSIELTMYPPAKNGQKTQTV